MSEKKNLAAALFYVHTKKGGGSLSATTSGLLCKVGSFPPVRKTSQEKTVIITAADPPDHAMPRYARRGGGEILRKLTLGSNIKGHKSDQNMTVQI